MVARLWNCEVHALGRHCETGLRRRWVCGGRLTRNVATTRLAPAGRWQFYCRADAGQHAKDAQPEHSARGPNHSGMHDIQLSASPPARRADEPSVRWSQFRPTVRAGQFLCATLLSLAARSLRPAPWRPKRRHRFTRTRRRPPAPHAGPARLSSMGDSTNPRGPQPRRSPRSPRSNRPTAHPRLSARRCDSSTMPTPSTSAPGCTIRSDDTGYEAA